MAGQANVAKVGGLLGNLDKLGRVSQILLLVDRYTRPLALFSLCCSPALILSRAQCYPQHVSSHPQHVTKARFVCLWEPLI
jgi:hypothetical protein